MSRIQADFSQISHEFKQMTNDDYICVIENVEEGKTKGTGGKSIKDQVHITVKVKDPSKPDFEDRELQEWLVLQKDDGQPNKISLGRIKMYAIAALGEAAANSPEGIDPLELKGATVLVTTKLENWVQKDETTGTILKSGISPRIEKVSPVR